MLEKIDPRNTGAWSALSEHYRAMKNVHMRDLFAEDADRFSTFSLDVSGIFLDYSKNIINRDTMDLLINLAEETKVRESVDKMFSGDKINETEDRAVLHTALRNMSDEPVVTSGVDIMPDVRQVLSRMKEFSHNVLSGEWKGFTGKPIEYIVNIGIGGSDLGPFMVSEALKPYRDPRMKPHFVSNIDGTHISEVLKKVDPETTLFFVASKTFTTKETLTNARTARDWFLAFAKDKGHIKKHFVAISSNEAEVTKFGILPDNIFKLWDWVGGRYSIWSSIGLSVACSIGFDNFIELLEGAYLMDNHFRTAPLGENLPAILALISLWYNNFFGAQTEAILPYDQYMYRFPLYFQQGNMESNGKSVDRGGRDVSYNTGPVIWGRPGTDGQHAFYQLIHQGTRFIPCDFIVPMISHNPIGEHHDMLVANAFAQTKALMEGKTREEVTSELERDGMGIEGIERLKPYKIFRGNRPTNTILVEKITPRTLGSLIAMYEHKIFVQGVIWNIFSFDQWGVELGKCLAGRILKYFKGDAPEIYNEDSSTKGLVERYKDVRTEKNN